MIYFFAIIVSNFTSLPHLKSEIVGLGIHFRGTSCVAWRGTGFAPQPCKNRTKQKTTQNKTKYMFVQGKLETLKRDTNELLLLEYWARYDDENFIILTLSNIKS